jgi:hypothetical protein
MSTTGTRLREKQCVRAERSSAVAERSSNNPLLLWSTGVVALVLCIIAFVLWGITGPGTLFDMIVALCT